MNESRELSFDMSQSPGSAKAPSLCFQADLSHILTTSLSWDADLLLHIPDSYLRSSSSSVLFFWAFIFLFGLPRAAAHIFGGVLPFQACSVTAVRQWGQLLVSCLHGRETSPGCRARDLIQISEFSACSGLFGAGLVSVTCQLQEAAKLLKNPGLEFWRCCRDFCSAVWLMVTSLLWNLEGTTLEHARLL